MLLLLLAKPAAARASDLVPAPTSSPAPGIALATAPEALDLTLDDGRVLSVALRVPAGARGPLPVLMVCGGLRRGTKVMDLIRPDRPMILASFDYPYLPPRTFRFPGSLTHAPKLRRAIHGSVESVEKLYATLRQRPDVDPARITVMGAGDGAPFALVGAARAGIPGVVLVHGFADVSAVVQNLFDRRPRSRLGNWMTLPARWLARRVIQYCEVPDRGAQARALSGAQKVLLLTAHDDEFIPRSASDAVWKSLQDSPAHSERLLQPGAHFQPTNAGDLDKVMKPAFEWMERQGLV